MFKKERDLTERSRTLLKNKEIRNLRGEIKKQYPLVDEEVLASVIPNKADVTCVKLANRTIMYEIEHVVLFFDLEGRNNLFPTVHTLWKLPDMMRTFYTHGPVSRFILNGADFMSPGIATYDSLTGLKKNEKCCVKIIGNPLPFAVGESLQDLHDLLYRRGKAVGILHVYGDLLANKSTQNEGFSFRQIKPVGGETGDDDDDEEEVEEVEQEEGGEDKGDMDATQTSEAMQAQLIDEVSLEVQDLHLEEIQCDDTSSNNNNNKEEVEEEVGEGGASHQEQIEKEDAEEEDISNDNNNDGNDYDDDSNSANDNDNNEEEEEEEEEVIVTASSSSSKHKKKGGGGKQHKTPSSSSRDSVPINIPANDAMLLRCFLLVCKYLVKDQNLPILASALWTLVQKVGQLEGQMIDIKQTSFKKAITFLHTLNVRSPGLLTCNEPSAGVISITKINRTHPILREYKIEQVEDWKVQVNQLTNGDAAGSSSSSSSSAQPVSSQGIQIHELFKLPKKVRELFLSDALLREKMQGEFGEHLKAKEVRELLGQFVLQEGLTIAEKKSHVNIPVTCGLHDLLAKDVLTNQVSSQSSVTQSAAQKTEQSANTINDNHEEEQFVPSFGLPPPPPVIQPIHPPVGLKIASSGLKNIDEMSDAELAEYKASYAKKLATLHPDKFEKLHPQAKGSKLTANAWENHAGGAWKPIALPSAAVSATTAVKGNHKPTNAASKTIPSTGNNNNTNVSTKKKETVQQQLVAVDYTVPLIISREELMKLFLSKLTPYHGIVSNLSTGTEPQVHIASGVVPKIKLMAEQRMGNKMVTIVRGLQHYFASIEELSSIAKLLQKKFACSVSVSPVPGIPKEKEILLQGNYANELEEVLVQYGLPKTVFEVSLGKGIKSKKK